jgi:YHS domain-containing protein
MLEIAGYYMHAPGKIFPTPALHKFPAAGNRTPSVSCAQTTKGKPIAYDHAAWDKLSVGPTQRRCAMKIDPVCGMTVEENSEFQIMFAGKKYYFCSDECQKEFVQQPEEYVETAA